jgi:hypothetical protein
MHGSVASAKELTTTVVEHDAHLEVTRLTGVVSNICDEKLRRATCDARISC